MKDYYYFLGIDNDASLEDIKKAYRKLSLKYHPDRTDNDIFFENRFKDLKEAYEVLIDQQRRKLYDEQRNSIQRNIKSNLPPKIKNFNASTIRAKVGDEVVLNWQTYDADLVKIIPFGLVKNTGQKTFNIKEFDAEGKYQILLHATNTLLQKTVVQGLTISEMIDANPGLNHEELSDNNVTELKKQNNYKLKIVIVIIVAVIILLWFSLN